MGFMGGGNKILNILIIFLFSIQLYKHSQVKMFRAIPTNNKICFDKDLKRSWRIHEQKLKRIKGSVGKDKPKQFMFLDQRPKKAALEEVRNIEIEKENHVLLAKIKNIEEKGCKNSYTKLTSVSDANKKRSLNEPFRKRELVKIVEENLQIMKRIQSKKSMYNIRKWEKERKEIEKNITLISTFPYKNYPSTQTQVNLWMTSQNFSKRKDDDKNQQNSRIRPASLTYEGTQKINDCYYLVSTYIQKKLFYIEIENLQNPLQKYRMEMDENEVYKLLEGVFGNSLTNLLNNLQIDSEKGCFLKYEINEGKESQFKDEVRKKSRPTSKHGQLKPL